VAYRLLAIDLDGTLLTRHERVSPHTKGALDAAAARGCQVVIATCRSFGVARYFCDELTLTAPQITYSTSIWTAAMSGLTWDPSTRWPWPEAQAHRSAISACIMGWEQPGAMLLPSPEVDQEL
jgi:hydroxymethylpyrimidine pyrophosphatase-like HAD family hydrolase